MRRACLSVAVAVASAAVGCSRSSPSPEPSAPPPNLVSEYTEVTAKPTGSAAFELSFVPLDRDHHPFKPALHPMVSFTQGDRMLCYVVGTVSGSDAHDRFTHVAFDMAHGDACPKPDAGPVMIKLFEEGDRSFGEIPASPEILAMMAHRAPPPADAGVPAPVDAPPPAAPTPEQITATLASFGALADAVGKQPLPADLEWRCRQAPPQATDPPAASLSTLQRLAGRAPAAPGTPHFDSPAVTYLAAVHDKAALPELTRDALRQLASVRQLMFVYVWKTFETPKLVSDAHGTYAGSFEGGEADGVVMLMDTVARTSLCWSPVKIESSAKVQTNYKLRPAQDELEADFNARVILQLYKARTTLTDLAPRDDVLEKKLTDSEVNKALHR
jgi:hypothetical protein|nr:hypothetical protein [Kofleriaceae bacterium]